MKKLLVVFGCVALTFTFAGCDKHNDKISNPISVPPENTAQPPDSNQPAVSQVTTSGGGQADNNDIWDGTPPAQEAMPDFFEGKPAGGAFPESMVGVWEAVVDAATGNKWGIKLEPDGSIIKIIHFLGGPINMQELASQGTGPDPGTYYLYVLGPHGARYIPKTRTIKVKIITDYYIMQLPNGKLEGRLEDYFEGPVSKDGKSWEVKWRNFGWLKGATVPDINLIRDDPIPLVFTKLDLNQISQRDGAQ